MSRFQRSPLIELTSHGLYCAAGDFYIDPQRVVPRAVITHAHSDHARPGHDRYLTTTDGLHVLRTRIGREATIDTLPYGEQLNLNGVRVSLHPAGHILGSAQVRVEYKGEVWAVSGDYKLDPDGTCRTFEPVACNVFITESTFGLPIYRWPPQQQVTADINRWWEENRDAGRASAVFAYSLGKAQRVLAGLNPEIGPIFCHESVEEANDDYRRTGIELPTTIAVDAQGVPHPQPGAMIIAPPRMARSGWLASFGDVATAFASGWMMVRKMRRQRRAERGFVLSDHIDWPGLNRAIELTGAEQVFVTHGQVDVVVRWLTKQGYSAAPLEADHDHADG